MREGETLQTAKVQCTFDSLYVHAHTYMSSCSAVDPAASPSSILCRMSPALHTCHIGCGSTSMLLAAWAQWSSTIKLWYGHHRSKIAPVKLCLKVCYGQTVLCRRSSILRGGVL